VTDSTTKLLYWESYSSTSRSCSRKRGHVDVSYAERFVFEGSDGLWQRIDAVKLFGCKTETIRRAAEVGRLLRPSSDKDVM
jgi:hypothetical protein